MPVSAQRFAAQWSLTVWIITLGVIVGMICLVGVILRSAAHVAPEDTAEQWLRVAGALLVPVVLAATVFFAPLGYTVHPQAIVVNRMGPNVVIPVQQIVEIRPIDSREIGLAIRAPGSGGFFGGFARFYSRRVGWFWAYTTTHKDLVLITQSDGTRILVSPSPPDAFLEAVERAKAASA